MVRLALENPCLALPAVALPARVRNVRKDPLHRFENRGVRTYVNRSTRTSQSQLEGVTNCVQRPCRAEPLEPKGAVDEYGVRAQR